MKFYIVDAFTDVLFGGNPAGVVILEKVRTSRRTKRCAKPRQS
jgi:predicted PhzF superfamily epimerase YddE/YHI9